VNEAKRQAALDHHVATLRRCRRCPKMLKPVVSGGPVLSRVMLVGQAPGDKEPVLGRPLRVDGGQENSSAGSATMPGWTRRPFARASHGRGLPLLSRQAAIGGDRSRPTTKSFNCSFWMKAEFELLEPQLIIAVGKLAILQFMPCERLDTVIGTMIRMTRSGQTFDVVPLPHPSGASPWAVPGTRPHVASPRHETDRGASRLAGERAEVAGAPRGTSTLRHIRHPARHTST